jgi:hypothetical protein
MTTNPLAKYLIFADEKTPESEVGQWVLVAPSGKFFIGTSPIKCVHAEMETRVPPHVALGRIARSIEDTDQEPTP